MAETLLELEDVRAGYGDSIVLDGITLKIAEGGSLAVLGRNGVGKTTLLLTIMGFTRLVSGAIAGMTAEQGTAVLLVEQHTEVALSLSDEAVVIERGTIALRGASQTLRADQVSLDRLIGLNLTAADAGPC